jgi:hypothetical protein
MANAPARKVRGVLFFSASIFFPSVARSHYTLSKKIPALHRNAGQLSKPLGFLCRLVGQRIGSVWLSPESLNKHQAAGRDC